MQEPSAAIVEDLVRAGGEADARLPLSGYSALELLAETPCADSAACGAALLRAGARPACTKVKSCSGRAVDVAGKKGNAALYAALLAAGASPAPIALSMRSGDDTMQSLNYLSLVCERGHAGVLQLALAAGCDPNTRCCQWGAPPLLCLALYFGHAPCATLLLAAPGIEVNVVYPVKRKGAWLGLR